MILDIEKNGRFCRVRVELTRMKEGERLSISGSTGGVVTRAKAKGIALEYWRSWFEDNPEEIIGMNRRFGKRFTSAAGAARFVLETDGELHGLDTEVSDAPAKTVRLIESCGQVWEEAEQFFPGIGRIWRRWHLDDMQAGTPRQMKALQQFTDDMRRPGESLFGAQCRFLKKRRLHVDHGHEFGSAWFFKPLPADVLAWARGELPIDKVTSF